MPAMRRKPARCSRANCARIIAASPSAATTANADILKRSLSDKTRRYSYALAIKEILVWNDVAVVRPDVDADP